MNSPLGDPLQSPLNGVSVAVERPEYQGYMELWRSIGDCVDWDLRSIAPAEQVKDILKDHNTQIYIARHQGKALGLCEFYEDEPSSSEIVYFGTVPSLQRQHLGRFFIDVALRHYWSSRRPQRVWLHTDSSDDPKALPLYLRIGFRLFATIELPDTMTEEGYRAENRRLRSEGVN